MVTANEREQFNDLGYFIRPGFLDARPQQHVTVEAHAEHALAGELGRQSVKRGAVAVDDGHFMADPGQPVRQ